MPVSPGASGMQPREPGRPSRGMPSFPSQLEWKIGLPWRPTRGSLTSPSYLVRKRTLGPPLENNPKTPPRSEEHTSELQSPTKIVCRHLLEKKKKTPTIIIQE